MTDNAGLKGAARIAAEQVASTKNVRIRSTELRRAYDEMSKRSCEKTVYIAECEDVIGQLQNDIERLRNQLYHATVAVDGIRDHALEEAAQAAEANKDAKEWVFVITAAIRALKDNS